MAKKCSRNAHRAGRKTAWIKALGEMKQNVSMRATMRAPHACEPSRYPCGRCIVTRCDTHRARLLTVADNARDDLAHRCLRLLATVMRQRNGLHRRNNPTHFE